MAAAITTSTIFRSSIKNWILYCNSWPIIHKM
jgi:hypothetical protein